MLGVLPVQHAEQAARFAHVALQRALVFDGLASELVEETHLAEHRADAAHLEHEPLQRLELARVVLGHELAALAREVDQNRARFEQREWLAVGTVGVEDRGDLVVRVERQELGRHLVVGVERHAMHFVGQAHFLQHDRDLHAVGRGQRVELQSLGVLGGPFLGDREGVEAGCCHGGFCSRETRWVKEKIQRTGQPLRCSCAMVLRAVIHALLSFRQGM